MVGELDFCFRFSEWALSMISRSNLGLETKSGPVVYSAPMIKIALMMKIEILN